MSKGEARMNPGARAAAVLLAAFVVASASGALRAQSATTVHAYFYVEPYSCRFECLVGVETMAALLKESAAATLPPKEQQDLAKKSAEAATSWLSMKINGEVISLPQVQTSIVKGRPGRTEVLPRDATVNATEAMVGFVWDVPLNFVPQSVEVKWSGFAGRFDELPLTTVAGPSIADVMLERAFPKHTWENDGRVSLRQPLVEVPSLPAPVSFPLPLGSILVLVLGGLVVKSFKYDGHSEFGRKGMHAGIVILCAAVFWRIGVVQMKVPFTENDTVTTEDADKILHSLLRNTYRSFDQRSEESVYDVLSRSVQGPLLQKIYLQIMQALALDAQDGTRVRVTDLSVNTTQVEKLVGRRGFVADATWQALGSIGHWGHVHARVNRYHARINVEPADGAWKLTGLEVIEQKRLE